MIMLIRRLLSFLLVVFLLSGNATFCEESLHLRLSEQDVEGTETYNGDLWLKLSPRATIELREITQKNKGKILRIFFKSMLLVEVEVYDRVDSGVIQVSKPISLLLKALSVANTGEHPELEETEPGDGSRQ